MSKDKPTDECISNAAVQQIHNAISKTGTKEPLIDLLHREGALGAYVMYCGHTVSETVRISGAPMSLVNWVKEAVMVRASDASDGTTSTEAQLGMLKDFGNRNGMIFVDAIILDGVTGSLPGKREDLQVLLQRKRQVDDFDVVLLQRLDRLTRGGSAHGFWFEHEAARVGLKLIFVGDDIPDGRYANLIKVAKYEAAQEQAFSISQRSTQGAQLALEEGRNITSARTPYGCWRLYLTADRKPSHIIADLGNGRQQKIDANTGVVIDTYGTIGGGSKGHYRKQKHERVLLTPGFADEKAVVCEIFDLHLRQGWGGKRIADLLNRRGVPSPCGKQWSQHQVEVIYEQECYTGRSIANRTSSAIYHERQTAMPKRVELDAATAAAAARIPVRQRPLAEWFVQDQPLMENFLDPELRKLAMGEHERLWARRHDPDCQKQSKNKHRASDYLLSGLLFAKQDGEGLVGILCGRVGKKVRYYRHRRGRRGYQKGSIFNSVVPAPPLERAVVELVQQTIFTDTTLRDRIITAVEAERARAADGDCTADLQRRRDQLRRRTELIVSTLDDETLVDAKAELERLKAERRSLDEQIANGEASATMESIDPAAVADAVVAQLRKMAENIDQMPTYALRQLITTVINRVTIDMETKEAHVEMAVPLGENFFPEGVGGAEAMRLEGTSASSTSYETHRALTLKLAEATCRYVLASSRACYECCRRTAA